MRSKQLRSWQRSIKDEASEYAYVTALGKKILVLRTCPHFPPHSGSSWANLARQLTVCRAFSIIMDMNKPLPTKTCATCGKPFAWRKKWAKCWDQVRHCSERCRRRKKAKDDS